MTSLPLGLALAASGVQSPKITVLELYTSQGCSSCPAADRLFQSYTKRRNMVALTFHVDYWDYLGWTDTLAKRVFSERQRAYADQRRDGDVYTPQIIVNGLKHVIGSQARQIDGALAATSPNGGTGQVPQVPMSVSAKSGTFVIKIGTALPPKKPATVWLALVRPKVTVKIKRGENRGKAITYHNVVHSISPVGMWSGPETTIRLQQDAVLHGKPMNCAVLLQVDSGPILAAAWMPPAPTRN
ncbi:MAG TPA: DUF1223 domain-containing protein [Hyphomicrobiaceae bacterium]|nr:DUF1223 domain-containing protein [Hyphomicrobiaceae bacterium]